MSAVPSEARRRCETPGTGETDSCKLPRGSWELNLGLSFPPGIPKTMSFLAVKLVVPTCDPSRPVVADLWFPGWSGLHNEKCCKNAKDGEAA